MDDFALEGEVLRDAWTKLLKLTNFKWKQVNFTWS
jgi:hypothetical protein